MFREVFDERFLRCMLFDGVLGDVVGMLSTDSVCSLRLEVLTVL